MTRRRRNPFLEFVAKGLAKKKKPSFTLVLSTDERKLSPIKGTIQEGAVYTVGKRVYICLHQRKDTIPLLYGPPPTLVEGGSE